jgi:hypothetical protein
MGKALGMKLAKLCGRSPKTRSVDGRKGARENRSRQGVSDAGYRTATLLSSNRRDYEALVLSEPTDRGTLCIQPQPRSALLLCTNSVIGDDVDRHSLLECDKQMSVSLSHELGANELRPPDVSQIDSLAPRVEP